MDVYIVIYGIGTVDAVMPVLTMDDVDKVMAKRKLYRMYKIPDSV